MLRVRAFRHEPLPGLVESDVGTDDKDSVSGSPNLESGGDKLNVWADHPARQLDFENKIKLPTAPAAPKEAVCNAPEEAEDL